MTNERIKELANEAGFVYINGGIQGQRWYSSKCGMDEDEFEKFAELIIKECARLADTQAHAIRADGSRQTCGYVVKHHFGVE